MKGGRGSGRAGTGQVRLWGRHAVEAALGNADRRCFKLRATREALAKLPVPHPPDLSIEIAETSDLDRLVSRGAPHQGLVLDCSALSERGLDELLEEADGRPILILDQVSDPHNIGAVLRSAAAFGAAGIVMQDRHSPSESGTIGKAASGALESVPWIRVVNLARALDALGEAGYWRIGLTGEAPTSLEEAMSKGSMALVLGAEGAGLRENVAAKCDALARLAISPSVESLNVSNAAAVALYIATRSTIR
jgi:23S rRNA (guanosine2251-2'-O)-methyltransferase